MSALLRAVDALNDRLIAAGAIGEALDLAGGESPPAWVAVYQSQIEAIREAAEALETLVRGIGGVAPDIAATRRNGIEGGIE
ncbi:hypothetical protein [Rhodoferax sp. BLA1]|uniref:hypothetical protein n=1 Tax=Rhodoferax sp. BLA1 TaxID=2576062 RepID=UPI0015D135FE|nr:hypothetical protein [Rhodoferax sp. BLA1]